MNKDKKDKNKLSGKGRMLWSFLRGCKAFFLLSMLCTVFVSLFELINPKIIGFTIDSVIGSEAYSYPEPVMEIIKAAGGPGALGGKLWIIALCVLGVSLAALIFRYLFKLFNSFGAEKLLYNMRTGLFAHIERLPFSWHNENQTGDIIQRCTSDVETVKRFLSDQLTSVIRIVIMIVMSLVFMFGMNKTLAFIALASIPVIVTYSVIFHRRVGKRFQECDEAEGVLSAVAQENLTGVRVVRAFGREKFERERFEKQSGVYANLWIKLNKLFSLFWGFGDLISGLQVMLIIVVGAVICVKGEMTPGSFITFISYNSMLVWPVRQLGRMISEMSKAGISLDRIAYIMNSGEERDREGAVSSDMKGDIVFDNVSYSYIDGKPVLDNVSFTIEEGKTFGILGGTGSGKTTLMLLLDRLYDLPEDCGKITVGGRDIRDITAQTVRKNIGMVLQEPFLFSRTIAENIAITDAATTREQIESASATACLTEAVEGFASGYDTMVGERGVTLSGGQKQRTAIARMLTQNTPIMIFDDSLSAVDAETDSNIRHALRERTSDATVILISHRMSTLMHADRILVLDHGKVAEIGNHSELLAKNGIYRKIYDIQMQNAEA